MIAKEILRREEIINRYFFGELYDDSNVLHCKGYYSDVGSLVKAAAIVCADFDVELQLTPVQEPKGWFIANIGGTMSKKFFSAGTAIFVALSNFLETKNC